MADIQAIYSILLATNYQDKLFSSLPGEKKKQKAGRETLATCPFCSKEEHFSYSSQKPVWRCWSCGESGDWIKYLEKQSGYDFQRALMELASQAGVEISTQSQANYQAYIRKADILETAQETFKKELQNKNTEVYNYLLARGYTFDDIYDMELGAYVDRAGLQKELKRQGYTDQEIQSSGLLTPGFGEDYKLTLLWRDQAGRAIGIVGRPLIDDKGELGFRSLSKYKYSFGMEREQGLVGFSSCRGYPQIVLLEGVLDALYLNYKGFKTVAIGGAQLSTAQLKALETVGTKEILLSLDMDEAGQKATEQILKSLTTSSLRAYVISLPKGFKDPDELVRKEGTKAFQEALNQAESWPKWMARRIVSKHDISTDRGLDQALEDSLDIYSTLEDRIEARGFMDSLKASTSLSEEDLANRLQKASQKVTARRAQAVLQNSLKDIQERASQGDITGAELELSKALRDIRNSRGVEPPEPYLIDDLSRDILSTPPALFTGYKKLDDVARIPIGAITIIAGRPGHGKTTLQLNLLVNMLRRYPNKKFYFFSYEESRRAIATKLIMLLAREMLSQKTNSEAYLNYFQEKRGSNQKIEQAIKEYEKLTTSGRLLISDKTYTAEDLSLVIGLLAKGGDTGAVIVDYIQKIPLLRPSQGQRYLDIKQVSALLLEQAVSQEIPIILGAQLNRNSAGGAPKLQDMRESGDIEQDANLVLALYTEAVENLEKEDYKAPAKLDTEVDIQVEVLKNRGGEPGRKLTLAFNRPILTISDKTY